LTLLIVSHGAFTLTFYMFSDQFPFFNSKPK
jgi:hypothetical protein